MAPNSAPTHRGAWIGVIVWSVFILGSAPFMQALQKRVAEKAGAQVFLVVALVLLSGAILVATAVHLHRRGWAAGWSVLRLLTVLGLCGWWCRHLAAPVEAMHFVEYGVLGILLHRALRSGNDKLGSAVLAILAGTLVGTLDELVQWVSPERFFDFHDIWLNAGASALAQLALWRAPSNGWGIPAKRLGHIVSLLVIELGLFMLLVVTTPQLVEELRSRHPALSLLGAGDDVVAEYGYRLVDPDIGVFFSRFSKTELIHLDQQRGPTVAPILKQYRSHQSYPAFLSRFPANRAPFLHEARVHLYSRNHNYVMAVALKDDPDAHSRYRTLLTRADRENRILERYFHDTIRLSGTELLPHQQEIIDAAADRHVGFTSKAGAHLITFGSETQLLSLLGGAWAVLVGAWLWLWRARRHARS